MSEEKSPQEAAEEAVDLVKFISTFLHGRGPDVQGAVLAGLASMYFAGHAQSVRAKAFDLHFEAVRTLTAEKAREMWPEETGPAFSQPH